MNACVMYSMQVITALTSLVHVISHVRTVTVHSQINALFVRHMLSLMWTEYVNAKKAGLPQPGTITWDLTPMTPTEPGLAISCKLLASNT